MPTKKSTVENKVLKMSAAKMTDMLYKATQNWAQVWLKPDNPLSERVQDIVKVLKEQMPNTPPRMLEDLAKLASVIVGEEIIYKSRDDVRFMEGIVLVPTANPNSHSYHLGEPIVCLIEGSEDYNRFVRMSGDWGNCLTGDKNALRAATKEEIRQLVDALIEKNSVHLTAIIEHVSGE